LYIKSLKGSSKEKKDAKFTTGIRQNTASMSDLKMVENATLDAANPQQLLVGSGEKTQS